MVTDSLLAVKGYMPIFVEQGELVLQRIVPKQLEPRQFVIRIWWRRDADRIDRRHAVGAAILRLIEFRAKFEPGARCVAGRSAKAEETDDRQRVLL